MSKTESKLNDSALGFADFLANRGWKAKAKAPHSPYAVKVAVGDKNGDCGNIVIYYSSKKGFSFVVNEVTQVESKKLLDEAWKIYRSLDSIETGITNMKGNSMPGTVSIIPPVDNDAQLATIYVDGSFRDDRASYGYVVIHNGIKITEGNGCDVPESWLHHQNVAGEMWAVLKAVEYCEAHNWEAVRIAYDYEGLEAWPTGRWRAKNASTQYYRSCIQRAKVEITWIKVKAHSGVLWNERADALAAEALAAPQTINSKTLPDAGTDFLTEGFAQFERLSSQFKVRESLRREYQLNFDVLDQGKKLGSGALYVNSRGKFKLSFHSNLPIEIADHLTVLWEKRHLEDKSIETVRKSLSRTNHVLDILSFYKNDRVSMVPLYKAFQDDIEAVCSEGNISPSQESVLRELASNIIADFDTIAACVEQVESILQFNN